MRFFGSNAPASAAGVVGHFATARAPARIADLNDLLSIFLRPGINFGLVVSAAATGPTVVATASAFFVTSPPAEFVESETADAFASGCALQAASATPAQTDMT